MMAFGHKRLRKRCDLRNLNGGLLYSKRLDSRVIQECSFFRYVHRRGHCRVYTYNIPNDTLFFFFLVLPEEFVGRHDLTGKRCRVAT
jgi:hypothetical protein